MKSEVGCLVFTTPNPSFQFRFAGWSGRFSSSPNMSKRRSSTVIENPDKRIRSDVEAEEDNEEEENIADNDQEDVYQLDVHQLVGGKSRSSLF